MLVLTVIVNSGPPGNGELMHGFFQEKVIGAPGGGSDLQFCSMCEGRSWVKVMGQGSWGSWTGFLWHTPQHHRARTPYAFMDGWVATGQLHLVHNGATSSSLCSPETEHLLQACPSWRKWNNPAVLPHKHLPICCWDHTCWSTISQSIFYG